MACFVEMSVITAWRAAIGLGRDDGGRTRGGKGKQNPLIGVVCLVGDQRLSLHGCQKMIGTEQIVGLPAG